MNQKNWAMETVENKLRFPPFPQPLLLLTN